MMPDAGEQRRRRILERLRAEGRTEIIALGDEFGVSIETVRRDLTLLEAEHLVRRDHGGASAVETTEFESSLEMRAGTRVAEKQRIATAVVELAEGAESIYIDEGFTPYLVAERLAAVRNNFTIVTPSLIVAGMLASKSHHNVILLGGVVRGRTMGTIEHWAIEMLADLTVSLAVIGANGISRERGLTTPDTRVAAVKAAALRTARKRVFVGVHTKFGVATFCRFGEISDLDFIVTETALPAREAHLYSLLGPKVIRT